MPARVAQPPAPASAAGIASRSAYLTAVQPCRVAGVDPGAGGCAVETRQPRPFHGLIVTERLPVGPVAQAVERPEPGGRVGRVRVRPEDRVADVPDRPVAQGEVG